MVSLYGEIWMSKGQSVKWQITRQFSTIKFIFTNVESNRRKKIVLLELWLPGFLSLVRPPSSGADFYFSVVFNTRIVKVNLLHLLGIFTSFPLICLELFCSSFSFLYSVHLAHAIILNKNHQKTVLCGNKTFQRISTDES